jgi:signal transduction histidine kinase
VARDGRAGGLGLGLAVAKHVVQLHGGRIAAENRGARGTRFIVDLAVCNPQTDLDVESAGAAPERYAGSRQA